MYRNMNVTWEREHYDISYHKLYFMEIPYIIPHGTLHKPCDIWF